MFIVYASIRQHISGHCFLGLNLAFSRIPRKTVSNEDVTELFNARFYKEYKKSIKMCEMIINTKKK